MRDADGGTGPRPVVVSELAVGGNHTCALLSSGVVKCWGENAHGQLGYGHTNDITDPATVGPVSVTTTPRVSVAHLWAGFDHTCALLSDATLKCWGWNQYGQLGYGHTANIGDDELPSSVGAVGVTTSLGVTVTQIAASYFPHVRVALGRSGQVLGAGGQRPARLRQHGESRRRRTSFLGRDGQCHHR